MLLGSVALCASMPAFAQPNRPLSVDTTGQSLTTALTEVAQRSARELVMAPPALKARPAPRLKGRYTLDQVLPLLLAGSGLTYRRSADGVYIVDVAPALPPPEPDVPVALPELLVTARSQNSDIQRTENDIQPYKVWSSRDIEQAHSADIDDFLRSRATGDAQPTPHVAEAIGSNRSEINLRGMGSGQTLVLIDGRRMPNLPPSLDWTVSMLQADLNGVSLAAVDRIEILNSTAGGIYGVGATAGAVNIVLKRDYEGADLGVTYGVSSRGDAAIARISGRAGFTSEDGRSQAMIFFGRDQGADLRVGDRDFTVRARALRALNDPTSFALSTPISRSINIVSASGGALTFDPIYGGGPLGAAMTSVPASYAGISGDGGARLRANAGRIDLSLTDDAAGARRSLLTQPVSTSVSINGRHRFGSAVEAYVDGLFIQNSGQADFRTIADPGPQIVIAANAPTNPFQQDIAVSFPFATFANSMAGRTRTMRLTGGLIADLPHAWKADIDYGWGRAQIREVTSGIVLDQAFYADIRDGLPTAGGATLDPLGGLAKLSAALAPYEHDSRTFAAQTNRMSDLSLRLAGPLLDAPGGPVTLSLLAEIRKEHVPVSNFYPVDIGPDTDPPTPLPQIDTRTRSLYAELRAPIVARDARHGPFRGLELQLAVRRDTNRATFDNSYYGFFQDETSPIRPRSGLTVHTAGFKTFPLDGVMLRASVASGVQPPALDSYDLSDVYLSANLKSRPPGAAVSFLRQPPSDPKRGGTALGSEHYFHLLAGAMPDLAPERAKSVSVGVVITPPQLERFRASIDYTRIRKRGEVVNNHNADYLYLLRHEDDFPGRITRAPLTDADRAKGYAGGVVTAIDASNFNIGVTRMEAVDVQADYAVPTERLGDLRFHAAATWQPKLKRHNSIVGGGLETNLVGYADGPLEWRANGGVDWSRGPLMLGFNAGYYDSYRVVSSTDTAASAAAKIKQQGASKIPAQVYVDIYGVRRWSLPEGRGLRSVEARFGVQNLLDHAPPVIATALTPNFSPYGDPRLRRLELSLVGRF